MDSGGCEGRMELVDCYFTEAGSAVGVVCESGGWWRRRGWLDGDWKDSQLSVML